MVFKGHADLLDEAQQLRAIFAASSGTSRANYTRDRDARKRKRQPNP